MPHVKREERLGIRRFKIMCLVLLMATFGITTGCANVASFQTAEVVDAGESLAGGGMTFTRYQMDVGEETLSLSVPALNLWYRYGVMENLEVHGFLWIPLGAKAGAKYQLLGSGQPQGPQLSVGADFGYMTVSSGSGDNTTEVGILDIYLPVYTGYRVSESLAFYLTPQYILRVFTGDGEGIGHTVGTTVGVALGENFNFHLEGTFAYDLNFGSPVINTGIGIAF